MAKTIEDVPAVWQEMVLICRKCSKKLGGGFGKDGDDKLAGALKHALRTRGLRRRVKLVSVGCLGLCPKGAVTTARASRPDRLLVVPAGADAGTVLGRLGLSEVIADAGA